MIWRHHQYTLYLIHDDHHYQGAVIDYFEYIYLNIIGGSYQDCFSIVVIFVGLYLDAVSDLISIDQCVSFSDIYLDYPR